MSKKKHKQQSQKRTGHQSDALPEYDDDELEFDLEASPRDDDYEFDDDDDYEPLEDDRFRSEFDRWRDGLGSRSAHGGHGRQRGLKKKSSHRSRGRGSFGSDADDDDQ